MIEQKIEKLLIDELSPELLEIIDESHKHAGHVGAHNEGESHFRLIIKSNKFKNNSRVTNHKMIYKIGSVDISL